MPQAALNTAAHPFHPCPATGAHLLQIRPGVRIESALEHAMNLLACARDSASAAANERACGPTSLWTIIHLVETAEALIDAVMLGLPANDDEGGVSL